MASRLPVLDRRRRRWTVRRAGEQGASLVEAALILPLLIVLFLFVVDLYFYANTYMTMIQTAREALLTGTFSKGQVANETQTAIDVANYNTCYADTLAKRDCPLLLMRWRIERLLESHSPRLVRSTTGYVVDIHTEIQAPSSGELPKVGVKIKGTYKSLFPLFSALPVYAEVWTSHLGEMG